MPTGWATSEKYRESIPGRDKEPEYKGNSGERTTLGWHPSCTCEADLKPAVCLDPFGGAGTVALVAQRLGRKAICIEISPEYARMAQQRVERDLPVTRRPNREKPGEFQLEFSD